MLLEVEQGAIDRGADGGDAGTLECGCATCRSRRDVNVVDEGQAAAATCARARANHHWWTQKFGRATGRRLEPPKVPPDPDPPGESGNGKPAPGKEAPEEEEEE